MSEPSIVNIHTPTTSFAIVHSITQESLTVLQDKLTRKVHVLYHGERIAQGWLKYEFNESMWSLDDDSDYTIWVWRQQQGHDSDTDGAPSTSTAAAAAAATRTPTLHLHKPGQPLPEPGSGYLNPAYYLFLPSKAHHPNSARQTPSPRPKSTRSRRTKTSKRSGSYIAEDDEDDGIPKFKKDFERFHSENGVRTVLGSIGPAQNVRMLLKSGHRHVYISRSFAMKHGFIPRDATPGHYGYSGLVNLGIWPITLKNSAVPASTTTTIVTPQYDKILSTIPSSPSALSSPSASVLSPVRPRRTVRQSESGPKVTNIAIYLSEEPHFDVVLGRSFFEKRQIRTSPIDPTDIVCLDTGEKIECELVILKDGKGEIVTVT